METMVKLIDETGEVIGTETVSIDADGIACYPAPREGGVWCACGRAPDGEWIFRWMED